MNDDDLADQYSPETADALRTAVDSLKAQLDDYVAWVTTMRGGSSEMTALSERNDRLDVAVRAVNDRVMDHTGTWPMLFHELEGDDGETDDGEDVEAVSTGETLSVVTRFDVVIADLDQLVTAGRVAHRQMSTWETEEDAEVAVVSATDAFQRLTDAAAEIEVEGVEIVSGMRLYLRPEHGAAEPATEFPGDPRAAVAAPVGDILFLEGWG